MIEPMVIEHEGKPSYVVIPWSEWERIKPLLEDAEAAARAATVLQGADEEWVPIELAERIWQGEHPVKVWREHKGLTQAQLAAAAGLPQPTVAKLETGARKGTVAQLRAIAQAPGIGLDTLLACSAEQGRPARPEPEERSR